MNCPSASSSAWLARLALKPMPPHNERQSGDRNQHSLPMPSLIKFLTILAIIAGIIYGAMVALVMLVEPRTGEITVRVPIDGNQTPGE